ncbi:hypothetical protein ASD37_11115 [Mycobacterium sp. Root135]|nr:hypothetical protein ASD37_11115 [Mycobacterium sp. Root135]
MTRAFSGRVAGASCGLAVAGADVLTTAAPTAVDFDAASRDRRDNEPRSAVPSSQLQLTP